MSWVIAIYFLGAVFTLGYLTGEAVVVGDTFTEMTFKDWMLILSIVILWPIVIPAFGFLPLVRK